MRDLVDRIAIAQSTATASPSSGNTDTNGTGISIVGWESITGLLRLAARTDGTYTPRFQVSNAVGGTYYDLDAAAYLGGVAPGAQNAVGDTLFGIREITSAAAVAGGITDYTTLTFVRIVVKQASGTTGATFGTDVILAFPRHSGVAV
jgi:hypothetical protein